MAKQIDRQAAAMEYMQLLQSGVPAAEAFKRVYPNGIPTAAQQQATEAKQKQGSALAGTGGAIAGLLGVKYAPSVIEAIVGGGSAANSGALGSSVVGSNLAGLEAMGASGAGATTAAGTAASGGAGAVAVPTGVAGSGATTGAGATAGGLGVGGTALASGGILAGGLGIRDLYTHDRGPVRSGLQGAASGAAAGAGIGAMFGGVGAIPGAAIGGGIGLVAGLGSSFAHHESTRDNVRKHTRQLLEASDNANYQNYVAGMREQYDSAPTDPSKPFAGKYSNFNEYKAAGLDPKDLTGVYGNIKTFGSDWANLSQDQREQVTQGLIGANLYDSKKGEVVITDADKAKQIYATVIKPQAQAVATTTAAPAVNNTGRPTALQLAQLKQTGQFGNKLFETINKR